MCEQGWGHAGRCARWDTGEVQGGDEATLGLRLWCVGDSGPWEELEMDRAGGEGTRGTRTHPRPLACVPGTRPAGDDDREPGVGQACKVMRLGLGMLRFRGLGTLQAAMLFWAELCPHTIHLLKSNPWYLRI